MKTHLGSLWSKHFSCPLLSLAWCYVACSKPPMERSVVTSNTGVCFQKLPGLRSRWPSHTCVRLQPWLGSPHFSAPNSYRSEKLASAFCYHHHHQAPQMQTTGLYPPLRKTNKEHSAYMTEIAHNLTAATVKKQALGLNISSVHCTENELPLS